MIDNANAKKMKIKKKLITLKSHTILRLHI